MKNFLIILLLLITNLTYSQTEFISNGLEDGYIKGNYIDNYGIIINNAGTAKTGLLIGDNGEETGNTGGIETNTVSHGI